MSLPYHDRTKHHFHRFAPSLGYLDWATQPNPFRRYDGARVVPLARTPLAGDVSYDELYRPPPAILSSSGRQPAPLTTETLAEFLRCSLGLSAWKQYGSSRWALRVNPSSGNLHPTEAHVVTGDGVFHYAPREHALEERCRLSGGGAGLKAGPYDWSNYDWSNSFLVGVTSIHWREAWKYGERAFRYCQHDCGHAIAALRFAAALLGWHCALLPRWSDAQVSVLLGLSQEHGEADPEPESPDCLMVVTRGALAPWIELDPATLLAVAQHAEWQGTPNRLSPSRVEWPAIEQVVEETRFPGITERRGAEPQRSSKLNSSPRLSVSAFRGDTAPRARDIILRRRSAVAFDGHSALSKDAFTTMLQRLVPPAPPWDAIWWPPSVHLVLFIHRVEGVLPGIYAFLRDTAAREPLEAACRSDLLWEPVAGLDPPSPELGRSSGLFLLAPFDCRDIARRLSCDQDIAADGFFGAAMLARFEQSIDERGPWFYRNLFWECGMVGQVLYLEAEAAGARATGIGCYYDEPTHELLGLSGRAWQSLYHFSAGVPVEDTRLMSAPGYEWET